MRLHFESIGEGPALVILHGLFGSLENWQSFGKLAAGRFRVLLPDARNHGHSPHHPEMTYPLMAADVLELLAAQDIQAARLVGHSMGGKVAMQAALDSPEKVRSLTVVDIAPKQYPRRHDYILNGLLGLKLDRYETRQQIEEALAASIPDLSVRRFLLKGLGRRQEGGFQWRMGLREIAACYDALGASVISDGRYEGPTLFVRGGASDYVEEADAPEILRLFPKARMETIVGAGHWVHAEKPAEFNRIVLEFLDRVR